MLRAVIVDPGARRGVEETNMSRAMNISATRAEVLAMSGRHSAPISTIEELVSGGTRVVYLNGDDAANVRRAFGAKVLSGVVTRTPLRGR